jgi:alpha-galactosidase
MVRHLWLLHFKYHKVKDMSMKTNIEIAAVTPWNEGTPKIQGPALTGASAGKPFIYNVPVTGERPLTFTANGLPAGLSIDAASGCISGVVAEDGDYEVLLRVENKHGRSEKPFTIAIGRGLALTPPMGWNSWNAWRRWVDDANVRAAAEAMVSTGLAARGYSYVNIDSCWQGERGGKYNAIQPNCKFPDMMALSNYIHGLGLKFGIYSTPWVEPWGCNAQQAREDWGGGPLIGCSSGERDPEYDLVTFYDRKYVGVNKHEPADVKQWVDWGVDFLKYDWAPNAPKELLRMAEPLKAAPRDIILSICTDARYEWRDVYLEWVEMWRSIPDTEDTWKSVLKNGFYSDDHEGTEAWRQHVRPGKWNDLDMTALGPQFESATSTTANKLTQDEQLTHMTLWALYPTPLILSCDLTSLNDFELRLFANEEVLAVNQDVLGVAATRVSELRTSPVGGTPARNNRVHARPLADGSLAVGIYNLAEQEDEVEISAEMLGVSRRFSARNLWERRELGVYEDRLRIRVPAHGAQMLKISGA